jgi:hypothetical protein
MPAWLRSILAATAILPATALAETVEFKVQGTGRNAAGFEELYSEASWQHPNAFFIRLPAGTIVAHYAGRTIRVTGPVQTLQFGELRRMAISVERADQIVVLDPLPPFTPTSAYAPKTVRGFAVLVHPGVVEQPAYEQQALAELGAQLDAIAAAVPAQSLARLRSVRIWLELKSREDAAAEFHPSREWLAAHGYNPEKVGGVEICNVPNWLAWSRADQPMSLLHELAHALHLGVLGAEQRDILGAYEHAMKAGLYDSVPYVHGGRRSAYATKNATEYFAELTEAYFGKNDYYPFTRSDLLRHDPVGYGLVERLWGVAGAQRF